MTNKQTNLTSWRRLKPFRGPHRYKFIDPDTGQSFHAAKREELVARIVMYRRQNELPEIENLNLVIDKYLCSLPENRFNCEEVKLHRGLMAYIKGGVSLIKNMLYDSYVDQDEADRRASICIKCPENVFPGNKTQVMQWTDTIAEHAVGDRKSIYHEELGNCAVCSCVLKAKVWMGPPIEVTKEEEENLPSYCWQRRENQ